MVFEEAGGEWCGSGFGVRHGFRLTKRRLVIAFIMNTQPTFKGIVVVLSLLLSWMSWGPSLQAQTSGGATVNPVPLLKQALTLLEKADHDYDGHRVAAIKEIRGILHALANPTNGQANSTPGVRQPPNGLPRVGRNKQRGPRNLQEPQAASDALMKQAQELLVEASSGLTDIPLQRVNEAIAQIYTALQIR